MPHHAFVNYSAPGEDDEPLVAPTIPTFEEEGLMARELRLLDHWTKLSPQMAKQRKAEGRTCHETRSVVAAAAAVRPWAALAWASAPWAT